MASRVGGRDTHREREREREREGFVWGTWGTYRAVCEIRVGNYTITCTKHKQQSWAATTLKACLLFSWTTKTPPAKPLLVHETARCLSVTEEA